MAQGRDSRSQDQAVETAFAVAVGCAVVIAVIVAAWLVAVVVGAKISNWMGPAGYAGAVAGLGATLCVLARSDRARRQHR